MRVLHITHLYPRPYDHLLGIAMHKQIKALEVQGCAQKVLSPTAWTPFPINHLSHKWKSYSEVSVHDVIEGVEVYYPRYLVFPKSFLFASSGRRMYLGIRRLVREIEQEFSFDLIHAHMALPDGYAGMLISMKYRKPLVVTIQGTDLDITAARNNRCSLALHRVFQYAKRVISPSPRLTEAMVAKFRIEPVNIGYGINTSDVVTLKNNSFQHFEDRCILLSVSRLIPTKGIDLNLHALSRLVKKHKNIIYIVVGDGPERATLERLTRKLNLERYVNFVGHLPYRRVMDYMAACDVFVLPSWQETFGLVYIEAMAHGKPVVAVEGQGVDGIVIHGETGLLAKPQQVDSLVEALDFLLSHPEEARAIGERARELVLKNYTWGKNAEKTIGVYREELNVR